MERQFTQRQKEYDEKKIQEKKRDRRHFILQNIGVVVGLIALVRYSDEIKVVLGFVLGR